MSTVKFLRGTVLGAGEVAQIGDEIDLPEPDAQHFVRAGRAVFVGDEELPEDPGIVTTKDTPKPRDKRTR